MNITDADLLDGESLIQTKSANAVIKIDEHGLSRFAFDQLMWTIGMKGKEAIGGKIHLTNYRLIFQSHAVNRLTGKFSIFLPTISDLKDASRFLVKKMHVATQTQQFEFVIWGIPAFISQIHSARDSISSDQLNNIRSTAAKDFRKCGEGLKIFAALEAINVVLTAKKIAEIVKIAQNLVEVTSILNLLELFSDE